MERLWEGARRIEVQIVADGAGAVQHLWERDCSAQRRHQKLVEIAPARARRRGQGPVAGQRAAARPQRPLHGPGDGRIPGQGRGSSCSSRPIRGSRWSTVTEEVTGVDLVAAQLRIAAGEDLAALGLAGPPPAPRGHAVQVRVNAEVTAPDGAVRPSVGRTARFDVPTGPGVRVDTAARTGTEIGARYDPLLAKVVAHAPQGGFAAARTGAAGPGRVRRGRRGHRDPPAARAARPPASRPAASTRASCRAGCRSWCPRCPSGPRGRRARSPRR
ncbi:hypothetical protein [Streptomyces sp. KL116D]|uniref:ATP-binding protein n=1 Tax=Streptomyces sp. KL116D TaxID=3045152 RepID=UPI003555D66F